jgi:tripartite-type tricarboxylate transporter receptor subunit TctC
MGYKGSTDALLAMERREVEGSTTSWDGLKSTQPGWIRDKKINVIVQYTLTRHPDLRDVPTASELGRHPEEVQILRIVSNGTELGKLVLSTPDTPVERVRALRRAFDDTMKDPDFVKDLKASGFDLDPMTGEELQRLIAEVVNAPADVLAKVKQIYPVN